MARSPSARALRACLVTLTVWLGACGGDAAPRTDDASAADTLTGDRPAGPTATASPAARPDPCTLLTAQEVQAATGVAASAGQASTSGGALVCTWTDAAGKSALVQVHAGPHRFEESRQVFEQVYDAASEPVPGLGEQAFYIGGMTASFPTGTVSALQRGTAISTQVMGMGLDPATLRSQTVELARATLAKL
jgi:hypothetical protein